MTPNEITALIASNFDRELDMPFRLQLMERVKYWRSRLIANSLSKNPAQRRFYRQTLFMKMAPASGMLTGELTGFDVARTVEKIPQLIKIGSTLFDYVGAPDGKSPFKEVSPGTADYLAEDRFSKLFPQFEFTNGYITTEKVDQPMIRVDSIFDDPMAVTAFSCSQAEVPCDLWNTEFPISGDLLQLVVQSILRIDYNRPDREPTEQVQ